MAITFAHPVIALWAHPRSMSTATERIMRERGDLECLHEPFIYYYYVHLNNKPLPLFDVDPDHPSSFDEIIDLFRQTSQAGPVFFKDMGYYVLPEIYQRVDFARQLRHLFLIRDPRKSILSYYRLDPDLSRDEIGLAAQWQLFEWLRENDIPATIIEAEAVQNDPVTIMSAAWKRLGLTMKEHAFHWNEDSTPEDWQAVSGWHESALSSTGIAKPIDESEEEINEKFQQVAKDAPELNEYLDYHWPYYEKLQAISRSQFSN